MVQLLLVSFQREPAQLHRYSDRRQRKRQWKQESSDEVLDRNITPKEVIDAIKHLKNNKAVGLGGVKTELLKQSVDFTLPFLVVAWKHFFLIGPSSRVTVRSYPSSTTKEGNIEDPYNYRGISLFSIYSKMHCFIINKYLMLLKKFRQVFAKLIPQVITFSYYFQWRNNTSYRKSIPCFYRFQTGIWCCFVFNLNYDKCCGDRIYMVKYIVP